MVYSELGQKDWSLEIENKENKNFESKENKIIEDKKRWLDDYRYMKLQYDYYVDELASLETRKANLTKVLTGMPSGNIGKKMDQRWVDIMEYTEEIISYISGVIEEIAEKIKSVEEAISKLPQREQTLLTARYVLGKSFFEIEKEFPCSERTMYRIHEDALELIKIPQRDAG